MARGNQYTCAACGKEYEYCPKCAVTKSSYDPERFCSREHAEIFEILSKHGCHLTTAEDTLMALNKYNLELDKLSSSIRKHIAAIKSEVKPEPVEEVKQNFQSLNKDQKK
jgi:hypothetical protein